jgi:hypothetical protein
MLPDRLMVTMLSGHTPMRWHSIQHVPGCRKDEWQGHVHDHLGKDEWMHVFQCGFSKRFTAVSFVELR